LNNVKNFFLDAGLVFVVIPFAVTELKGSVFWSIIFFILLFFVGLDTMMASVETTVTAIVDIFPYLQKKKNREYSTTLAVCIIYFLIGLVFCLQSGFYWIHLFDTYSSGFNTIFKNIYNICYLVF
jgi:SNF family Na+-dependent transporter